MNLFVGILLSSTIFVGVLTMSISNGIGSLFNWSNTGTIEDQKSTGVMSGLTNAIQYGKSSLGIANVSDNGTNIGIKARVSLFTLLCDAIELFLRGNPIYEAMVQSVLSYTEKMICEDIGSPSNPTSYKAVRIGYVILRDIVLNKFTLSLI